MKLAELGNYCKEHPDFLKAPETTIDTEFEALCDGLARDFGEWADMENKLWLIVAEFYCDCDRLLWEV